MVGPVTCGRPPRPSFLWLTVKCCCCGSEMRRYEKGRTERVAAENHPPTSIWPPCPPEATIGRGMLASTNGASALQRGPTQASTSHQPPHLPLSSGPFNFLGFRTRRFRPEAGSVGPEGRIRASVRSRWLGRGSWGWIFRRFSHHYHFPHPPLFPPSVERTS